MAKFVMTFQRAILIRALCCLHIIQNLKRKNTGIIINRYRYVGFSNRIVVASSCFYSFCRSNYGILLNHVSLNVISISNAISAAIANGWKASYRFENFFTLSFERSSLSIS